MALPKTRISKARGRKRRTHYKAGHVTIMACPQCSQNQMPHRASLRSVLLNEMR